MLTKILLTCLVSFFTGGTIAKFTDDYRGDHEDLIKWVVIILAFTPICLAPFIALYAIWR